MHRITVCDVRPVPRRRGLNLVAATTGTLRQMIYDNEPGTRLGSLHDLARGLEVGIVTLQQAARVLEHEGLLDVRRGPGGGYYGVRPDDAALERALDAYLRVHPTTWDEALDMTSLLFIELCGAAAQAKDSPAKGQLRVLAARLESMSAGMELGTFEFDFQEVLFRVVRRPLFEMLTRVTLHFASSRQQLSENLLSQDAMAWMAGRQRIIAAILAGDTELARFEAHRSNRAVILQQLKAVGNG